MRVPRSESGDYSSGQPAVLSIPATCAGHRLDAALARLLPEYSRSRLQAWLKEGRILVDGDRGDAKRKVFGGEVIHLELAAPPTEAVASEAIALPIVFEDDALIVIDKPAGLVVHPGSGNRSATMMNGLLHHAPGLAAVPRAGIVHRLDKETSGLLVVAKTLVAQTDLVRQLQARSVSRRYLALAHGNVSGDGTVDAPIGRHPVQRIKMAVVTHGREARTHYSVREGFGNATLLECRLETGRTHQIRVHMASIGHPLVGDPVYGRRKVADARLDRFSRQALHAWQLSLRHPTSGQTVGWQSELPADFAALLEELRHG
jgi:23S rRNA pseudouridine1911/1915/1917 synthase